MPEARDTTVKFDTQTVEAPKTETVKETVAPEPKVYKQEDVDDIVNKVRKNTEYRTKRELKAYYEGRESAARPAEQQKPEPKAEKAPQRDDYPDWDAYSEAKADYVARKAVREENERISSERRERETAESRNKKMDDFRAKTKAKYADIEKRIEAIGDIEIKPEVADEIAESEYGPDIMNYFIEHPQDLERIAKLTPTAASRELGRLEARFESDAKKPESEKPTAPKTSAAPAPIAPISGGKTAVTSSEPSDKDSTEVWMQKRNAQIAAQKGLKL